MLHEEPVLGVKSSTRAVIRYKTEVQRNNINTYKRSAETNSSFIDSELFDTSIKVNTFTGEVRGKSKPTKT